MAVAFVLCVGLHGRALVSPSSLDISLSSCHGHWCALLALLVVLRTPLLRVQPLQPPPMKGMVVPMPKTGASRPATLTWHALTHCACGGVVGAERAGPFWPRDSLPPTTSLSCGRSETPWRRCFDAPARGAQALQHTHPNTHKLTVYLSAQSHRPLWAWRLLPSSVTPDWTTTSLSTKQEQATNCNNQAPAGHHTVHHPPLHPLHAIVDKDEACAFAAP